MKKKATSALIFMGATILLLSALSLTGCYYLRPTGPCLGVGCPARTAGQNGQYKKGEGPKSQPANVQNNDSRPANAQSDPQSAPPAPKEGNFFTNAWAKLTRSR